MHWKVFTKRMINIHFMIWCNLTNPPLVGMKLHVPTNLKPLTSCFLRYKFFNLIYYTWAIDISWPADLNSHQSNLCSYVKMEDFNMNFKITKKLRVALLAMTATIALPFASANAEGLKIGFSQVTLQASFYVQLKTGAEAAAKAGGDSLIFLDANGDVNKQNNDIQDLITQKVDVIIVNPVNPDAIVPSLEAAETAGIPIITVDRSVNEGKVATHIGRDNKAMGKLVGSAVVEHLTKAGISNATIVEIQGAAGGAVMMDRRDGFHAAIEGTGHKIIEGPYAGYIRSNAVTAMQDLLQANPKVNVVYAHNDDMALGALQVLQENNRKDVFVAGVDGLSEALDVMAAKGNYIASSLNDPQYLGDVTIQAAREVAAGNKIPSFIDAGTDLVTGANVDKIKHDALFAEFRPTVIKK